MDVTEDGCTDMAKYQLPPPYPYTCA
jgi:hypothetical protein